MVIVKMANTEDDPTLSDIFDRLNVSYLFLDNSSEPIGSPDIQLKVSAGITDGEKSIELINMLNLFSTNESIEEVSTNEIKYIILPAFLGYFCLKNTKEDRPEVVSKAKAHYINFLKVCNDYGLTDARVDDVTEIDSTEEQSAIVKSKARKDLAAMEQERKLKIQRYKGQQERDRRLEHLYPLVQQDHVDEETKREYYLTLVKKWIHYSLEELDSIRSELEILEHMAAIKKGGKAMTSKPAGKPANNMPKGPFIITKDRMQKEVFGLGYPSVPTYSLDEFYEQQVQLGQIPAPGKAPSTMNQEPTREEEEEKARLKEEKVEGDDEETLTKAREWDEWKDGHRRGWGNRYNQG